MTIGGMRGNPGTTRRTAMLAGVASIFGGSSAGCAQTPAVPREQVTVSVRDFGAVGDGRTDDSKAVQAAYDKLVSDGGGILYFPPGTYRIALRLNSRLAHLRGAGRGVSILLPVDPDGAVLRILYIAGWEAVSIADLTLRGSGRFQGKGLIHGHEDYAAYDEYAGRTTLERMTFENFDRTIERPRGNIGLYIDQCTFNLANFHLWTRDNRPPPGDEMHGGNLVVTRSHLSGFRQAMMFMDCAGTANGQVSFTDCIFEQGSGFVVYLRSFNGAGGVPGMMFRNNWNELTATGRDLTIEGKKHPHARFLYARDCAGQIVFDDTPLGSTELENAQVETRSCALDNMEAASLDRRSQLIHVNARQFSGLAPGVCQSIAGPTAASGLRTPWFRMPIPRAYSRVHSASLLQRVDAANPVAFVGSKSAMTEIVPENAALPGQEASQRVRLVPGDGIFPAPGFAVDAGKWLVTLLVYRRVSGEIGSIQLAGQAGLSGAAALSSPTWEMLVNVSENPGNAVSGIGLWHKGGAAPGEILLGGAAVLAFDSRQEAIEFANSGLFPA